MLPSFVPGSTIDSILIALMRLRGVFYPKVEIARLYGVNPNSARQNLFGHYANLLAENVLGGVISAETLQREHSAAKIGVAYLSTEAATQYLREGLFGSPKRKLANWMPDCWRACNQCIEEDSDTGFTHWRVLHQLPGAASCLKHGSALHYRCGKCAQPLALPMHFRLPSDACLHCGSKRRMVEPDPSKGQVALMALYGGLFEATGLPGGGQPHDDSSTVAVNEPIDVEDFLEFYGCAGPHALAAMLGLRPVSTRALWRLASDGNAPASGALPHAVAAYRAARRVAD